MTSTTTPNPKPGFFARIARRMHGRERTTIEGVGIIIGGFLCLFSGALPELAPYANFIGMVAGGLCLIIMREADSMMSHQITATVAEGIAVIANKGRGVGAFEADVMTLAASSSSSSDDDSSSGADLRAKDATETPSGSDGAGKPVNAPVREASTKTGQ